MNKRAFRKVLGRILKERRTIAGMTQQDVADELGVTYQMYQKYERGVTGIELTRFLLICEILGAYVLDILAETTKEV